MRILISNGDIVTVNANDDVLTNTNLGIEDGRIKYIGEIPEEFKPDEIIDGKDYIIMPGLINTHTHLGMTLLRNYADDLPLMEWLKDRIWPVERKLSGEDVYWGTMLSIIEMIKSGTTSCLDMYFFMDEVAKAVDETGMRAVLSRGLFSEGDRVDEAFKETINLIEKYHKKESERITVMLGPHSPYACSTDYLKSVKKLAERMDVGIHIHVSESLSEVKESKEKCGLSPVELLDSIGIFDVHTVAAHCVHLSKEDIDILSEKRVNVANNPTSNMKLGNGFAPVCQMVNSGVNVSLGTDGVASNNNLNMFEEMHLASLINKGVTGDPTVMSANEVIRMATINGARTLCLEQEIGSVEVGKKADIILINKTAPHLVPRNNIISSIVYSAQASDVSTVIIDGKIVMEDRKLKNINEKRATERVEILSEALLRKCNKCHI